MRPVSDEAHRIIRFEVLCGTCSIGFAWRGTEIPAEDALKFQDAATQLPPTTQQLSLGPYKGRFCAHGHYICDEGGGIGSHHTTEPQYVLWRSRHQRA